MGVAVGNGVSVGVGVGVLVGVFVGVEVKVGVAVGVWVGVDGAKTFQASAGPYSRREKAAAASAAAHSASTPAAPAILRRVIAPAVRVMWPQLGPARASSIETTPRGERRLTARAADAKGGRDSSRPPPTACPRRAQRDAPYTTTPGYFALPILYMPVPQTGHTPFVAGLPFFIVTGLASFISRCVRHFRQYASTGESSFEFPSFRPLRVRLAAIAYTDKQLFELESDRGNNRPAPSVVKQIQGESSANLA
jgi:hypothetical protein